MARLAWNDLISKHPKRYCLSLLFHDYLNLKKAAAKQKRPIPLMPDGKVLPTPSAIVSAMAKAKCKGDYSTRSTKQGCYVTLMMSEKIDAGGLSNAWSTGDGKPCTETSVKDVWGEDQTDLAKALRLI